MACDFYDSDWGCLRGKQVLRRRFFGRIADGLFDLRLRLSGWDRDIEPRIAQLPSWKVLVVGVDVPARSADLTKVMGSLVSTRHEVTRVAAKMHDGLGKFQNINRALAGISMDEYEWLIVTDDDISFAPGFLDRYLYLADRFHLALSMAAHNFRSYQTYLLTQRAWNSLARETGYVESGPITFIRRPLFGAVLPFPELRWAWATEVWWAEKARKLNMPIGVVDATPVSHLRPVARTYDRTAAVNESREFVEREKIEGNRREMLRTVRRHALNEM